MLSTGVGTVHDQNSQQLNHVPLEANMNESIQQYIRPLSTAWENRVSHASSVPHGTSLAIWQAKLNRETAPRIGPQSRQQQ